MDAKALALQAQLSDLDRQIRAAESQRNIGAGAFLVGVVLLFLLPPLGIFILIIALLSYFTNRGKVVNLEGEKARVIESANR